MVYSNYCLIDSIGCCSHVMFGWFRPHILVTGTLNSHLSTSRASFRLVSKVLSFRLVFQSSKVSIIKTGRILGSGHPAAALLHHSASHLLARGGLLLARLHGLPGHLRRRLAVARLVRHRGDRQTLQLLLHPVNLETALGIRCLGGIDLLGLVGGDVQVRHHFANIIAKAPWENCVPGVLATADSVHLCAAEGLGFRSLPILDGLRLRLQHLLAGQLRFSGGGGGNSSGARHCGGRGTCSGTGFPGVDRGGGGSSTKGLRDWHSCSSSGWALLLHDQGHLAAIVSAVAGE